jgi:hypothetical protein
MIASGKPGMNFQQEMEISLRARTPFVYVVSFEE